MKLELKHLCAYLPYNVSIIINSDNVATIVPENITFILNNQEKCKLPLRPMSDITKEIWINGKKFVPMRYFFELYGGGYYSYESFCTHEKFTITENSSIYFEDAQKLIEWHFDIFGLIDAGLAININDIQVNP